MRPNWKKSHDRVKSNGICISVFIMGTQSFLSEKLKWRLHVFLLNALVYISRVFSCIVIEHRNCIIFFWLSGCIPHTPDLPVSSSTKSGPGWCVALWYRVSHREPFYLDSSLALFVFHYYDGFEDWNPEISPCLMFLYNKNELFGLPNKWHCVPLRLLYL